MTGKPRPPSWGPRAVLERLRLGERLAKQIRIGDQELADLGVEEEDRPRPQTYWNDIYEWRRREEGFDEAYCTAMRECALIRGELRIMGGARPVEFTPEKKQEFLNEMASNGGKLERACEVVGVSMGHVLTTLNEKATRYDEEFKEAFLLVEAERLGEVYEAYFEEALTLRMKGEATRNPLVLTRLGESRLAHLLNPKKQIEVEAHHSHELLLPADVTRQIEQQRKAFTTAQVSAEEVIEVEAKLLPEKVEAAP